MKMKKTLAFVISLLMFSSCMVLPVNATSIVEETSIETTNEEKTNTLTEAYNKLDSLLYSYGIGWRNYLAPLDECLEIEHIIYYYLYYDSQACDTVLKLCEENGIDINLLNFSVLESGEEPEIPIETPLEGDTDGNGKTDILDVIIINKAVLSKEKLTDEQLKAIDFNNNGKPDAEDALILMKKIVGLTD